MTPAEPSRICRAIDHTLLKPDALERDVERLCSEARDHDFASVCVLPGFVSRCAAWLSGSSVAVGTVVGFPLGASRTRVKSLEAELAVEDGAQELDMVVSLEAIKSGNRAAAVDDISAVVVAAGSRALVKVILETGLLSRDEMVLGVEAARDAGAAYVKTSTGMLAGGATVEHVALLKQAAGGDLKVKASGGIRTLSQARELIAAGADRLGTSSGVAIAREAAEVRS